jgi:hypothetical protein
MKECIGKTIVDIDPKSGDHIGAFKILLDDGSLIWVGHTTSLGDGKIEGACHAAVADGNDARMLGQRFSWSNVKVVAPPPLESEGVEIERLKGGCPPTPCSESSLIEVEFLGERCRVPEKVARALVESESFRSLAKAAIVVAEQVHGCESHPKCEGDSHA